MICYRDMTFCRFYGSCKKGEKCERALTPEVQKSADKWWGEGFKKAPICVFTDFPKCMELKEEKQ